MKLKRTKHESNVLLTSQFSTKQQFWVLRRVDVTLVQVLDRRLVFSLDFCRHLVTLQVQSRSMSMHGMRERRGNITNLSSWHKSLKIPSTDLYTPKSLYHCINAGAASSNKSVHPESASCGPVLSELRLIETTRVNFVCGGVCVGVGGGGGGVVQLKVFC